MEENYLRTSLISCDLSETVSSSLGLEVVRAGLTAQASLLSSSGSAKSEQQLSLLWLTQASVVAPRPGQPA